MARGILAIEHGGRLYHVDVDDSAIDASLTLDRAVARAMTPALAAVRAMIREEQAPPIAHELSPAEVEQALRAFVAKKFAALERA